MKPRLRTRVVMAAILFVLGGSVVVGLFAGVANPTRGLLTLGGFSGCMDSNYGHSIVICLGLENEGSSPVTLAVHITLDRGQTTASLTGATLRYTTIDGLPYQAVTNSVTGFVPNDHTPCR